MLKKITGIMLLVFAPLIWAAQGTNPISFTLTPSSGLPATTQIGNSYAFNYILTNNLPFNVTIKEVSRSINGTGFTVTDLCSGKVLAKNATCSVTAVFNPTQTGTTSIQFSAVYDKNVVPFPKLSTNVQANGTTEISGAVTETLPANSIINNGYEVQFTFTNKTSASITASSVQITGDSSNFVVSSNTCLSPLTGSCSVTGTYTPTSTGEKNIGVTYFYQSNTKSVALNTHTIATSSSGGCVSVNGSGPLLLPSQTYLYANNEVKFRFTNQCDAASATLGTVNFTGTYTPTSLKKKILKSSASASNWITKGTDNCSGQTLAPNAYCDVYASVVPAATGSNLLIDASLSYSQSSQTQTAVASSGASSILANNNSARMVTIVNQCSVPVWATFVAAAVTNSPNCTTNSDCPSGSVCNSNICYFANPSLDGNHQFGKMAAALPNQAPDTMNIIIPQDNAGTSPTANILYNAGIAGRLGCSPTGSTTSNPLVCTVNNCGGTANPGSTTTDSDGQCTPGVGPSNSPGMTYNAVEFTFLRNYVAANQTTDGIYDEQTINGVTIPMEMKGRGPFTGTAPYQNCQTAGGLIQQVTGSATTQLGNCAYDYTTPVGHRASNYRFVTFSSGATDCSSADNVCTGTDVCGLTYDPNDNFIKKRCGQLAGYVSVNVAICAQSPSAFEGSLGTTLQAEYNCNTNYTYSTGAQLFACTGTYAGQSCYNPLAGNPATSCCGCVDWWTTLGGSLPVPTTTKQCSIYVNPDWADPSGIVQSQIQWVKSACPTAYSFQYDDPSSQFSCTVTNNGPSSNGQIVTNYQVTFCPGGKEVSTVAS